MRDAAIDTERGSRRSGTGRTAPGRQRGDLSSAAIAAERLGGVVDKRPAPRRTKERGAASRTWAMPSVFGRVCPVKALTTVAFAAALVGILANAVLFQRGREQGAAPDATRSAVAKPPPPPVRTAAAEAGPAPVAAPAPDPAPAPAAADSVPAPSHKAVAHARSGTKPPGGDAIGRLLGAPEAAAPAARTAEAKPDPQILKTQRQLKTLGYAVKPDGHMDGGTRQAIRRFAHDHHLGGDAKLTPELRRQIADASSASAKPAEKTPKAQ